MSEAPASGTPAGARPDRPAPALPATAAAGTDVPRNGAGPGNPPGNLPGNPPDGSVRTIETGRTARVVVLGDASAPRALVALHGYGQRADLFARHLAPHAGARRRIVVPEALSHFYLDLPTPERLRTAPPRRHVGASWATRLARDADVADHVAYLDRAAHAFLAPAASSGGQRSGQSRAGDAVVEERVDGETVAGEEGSGLPAGASEAEGLGFSQGAAMLCRWAASGAWPGAHPLRRLVLWGGTVPDDVLARVEGGVLRLPPIVLVCGDTDAFVAPGALAAHAARLADLGLAVETRTFAGGHRLDAATLAAVLDR